jgi:protein-tyrosine phosphatase
MEPRSTTSVLFVCLGNICRSPLAEGVLQHLLAEEGMDEAVTVESAGTGSWHIGERADPRSREVAQRHGIELTSRARQVSPADFERFDLIVAMDRDNLANLRELQERSGGDARLALLRDWDPEPGDGEVPDPYFGGDGGFDRVYEMLRRSLERLVAELRA